MNPYGAAWPSGDPIRTISILVIMCGTAAPPPKIAAHTAAKTEKRVRRPTKKVYEALPTIFESPSQQTWLRNPPVGAPVSGVNAALASPVGHHPGMRASFGI